MALFNNILDVIGNTPMVRLNRVIPREHGTVYAKLELFNPSGSVKARAALAMITAAEQKGLLKPGMVIVEATSGNLGLAISMVASVRGYRVVLFVEENDRIDSFMKTAQSFGAEVVFTASFEMAVHLAAQFAKDDPNVFVLSQFTNPANPQTHEETTALEIVRDTGPRLKAFVASFGSGGTFTGISAYLKAHCPQVEVVLAEPEGAPLFSGGPMGCSKIHGVGPTFKPAIMEGVQIDTIIPVTVDSANAFRARLAREEGLFVGPSSGAIAAVAASVAAKYGPDDIVVAVFPDDGNRYINFAGIPPA
ncbi:MAG: cysteine synthase family protein [Acidobacteriia bacterium]|nr:cysteine synthase family protein [Terriglobia bacterium]